MKKKTMVMAVYNPIEVDGRVKRTAQTLSGMFDLTVICIKGDLPYSHDAYKIVRFRRADSMGRTLRLFIFWLRLIIYVFSKRPDILYVHDFFLPFPGWIAARLSGAKLVYDAHELIIPDKEQALAGSEKLFYKLEKKVIRRCNLVIAANPERAEMMKNHYQLINLPVSIRNIPPVAINRLSDKEILEKYPVLQKKNKEDVHVVYMGDINFERGLGVLIDAIYTLPSKYRLFFVGKGPDLDKIKKVIDNDKSDKVNLIGGVAHAEVHDVIRQADIGYLSYSMTGLNNIYCSPNKIFEYPQAGLPIISTCQPTTKHIFEQYCIGELVGCDNTAVSKEMIATGIVKIADNYNSYTRSIGSYLDHYTWESQASQLLASIIGIK